LGLTFLDVEIMEIVKNHFLTETNQVFISTRKVMAQAARIDIPEGYRQATLREVGFRYKHDEEFRSKLSKCCAWIDQRGLNAGDYHQVHNDGSMTNVDADTYLTLPAGSRAFFRQGGMYVTVTCNTDQNEGRLLVDAMQDNALLANVAYVKDPFYSKFNRIYNNLGNLKRYMRSENQAARSSDI
jgi:hypothetical protein